jgi:hypothetical protein
MTELAKDRMANGNDYWFAISGRQSAEIRGPSGATLYCLRRRSEVNRCHGRHEWVFSQEGKYPLFAVHRVRRFPCLRYAITRDGREVGTVSGLNLLRTRYYLKFATGPGWVLFTPMYSVFYYGISDDAGAVAVRQRRHNTWGVRFGPDLDSPELIAALAFVFIGRWASW